MKLVLKLTISFIKFFRTAMRISRRRRFGTCYSSRSMGFRRWNGRRRWRTWYVTVCSTRKSDFIRLKFKYELHDDVEFIISYFRRASVNLERFCSFLPRQQGSKHDRTLEKTFRGTNFDWSWEETLHLILGVVMASDLLPRNKLKNPFQYIYTHLCKLC